MDEQNNMHNPFLIGNKVYLRALEEADLEGNWYKWFNDPDVTKYLQKGFFPNTKEKQRAHLEKMNNSSSDLLLAIISKAENRHIGVVGLHNIDWINRKAEISIVVGEKKYWGLEYSLEAMALLSEHGFHKLNLHKIYAGQHEALEKWRKVLELIGFNIEGALKEDIFTQGKYWDVVKIAVFARDFFKLKEQRNGRILGNSIKELLRETRKKHENIANLRKPSPVSQLY